MTASHDPTATLCFSTERAPAGSSDRSDAAALAAHEHARFRTHPYRPFLHDVERPARYVGGEYGAAEGRFASARCRMALCFPDVYEIGMSHLGVRILYDIINRTPGLAAERCFAPWPDLEHALRSRALPLVTLESAMPLSAFDVLGFSLQFDLTFTNILNMLELGGVALRSDARSKDAPLVIAGGSGSMHPEPIAPFVDIFFPGDGEELSVKLMKLLPGLRHEANDRRDFIRLVVEQLGGYAPMLHETRESNGFVIVQKPDDDVVVPYPVPQQPTVDLAQYAFPAEGPVANVEQVFDRATIEIARGCTEGCRFCQAGMIYRPVRERPPKQIRETAKRAIAFAGFDEVAITSLSTADYSRIEPLVGSLGTELAADDVSLSVSSLRAYGVSDRVLKVMRQVRASGLTFAPEAATARMRDVINKNITDEDMEQTARRVFARGFEKVKLYFMIGLPTETDEDVEAIFDVGMMVYRIGREVMRRGRPSVTCSVSTFVPKPHTPFECCAMLTPEENHRRQSLLRARFRGAPIGLKLHDGAQSFVEGVLSRGDRKTAEAVEAAYRRGARFDSWDDHFSLDLWMAAFAEVGVEPRRYLDEIPWYGRVPWDHINAGVTRTFLEREWQRAVRAKASVPCSKPAPKQKLAMIERALKEVDEASEPVADPKVVCFDCGLDCDLDKMSKELPKPGEFATIAKTVEAMPDQRRPTDDTATALEPGYLVRFEYARAGRAALLSHLDMVRLLPRMFRRAGVRMVHSKGFHPRPQFTFAQALPTGAAARHEPLDIMLHESVVVSPESLVARLNDVAPPGVVFLRARRVNVGEPSLTKSTRFGRYALTVDLEHLPPTFALDEVVSRARDLIAATSWSITRERGGVTKTVDVRPSLARLDEPRVTATVDAATIDSSPTASAAVRVEFVVDLRASAHVRADELASALFGGAVPFEIERLALFGGSLDQPINVFDGFAATRAADKTEATGTLTEEACG